MSRLRALVVVVLAFAIAAGGFAVTQASAATNASVTGVVTVDGTPAAGLEVVAWPEGSGAPAQANTAASGQFTLPVQVDAVAGTSFRLDIQVSDPASHVVPEELLVHVGPGQTLVQDVSLSTFDARLVATIGDVPAGVSTVEVGAGPTGKLVGKSASYTPAEPLALNGLPSGDNSLNVAVGITSDNATSYTYFYYPGTTNEYAQTPLPLTAGCTTSLAVDVAANSIAITGRDCARLPACQSANAAAGAATAALAAKAKTLSLVQKKYKKAKKKYKKHHLSKKKLKKLKKNVKKAAATKKRYAAAQAAAAASAQSTCH